MAEDGEKVDEEGVTVIAASQLEELIGPMDDEARLPDEPTSPSGLGEGGKREREQSAQLTPGESEPKQSRQAGIMRHLSNREIWGKIQEWGNAEEASNPTAISYQKSFQ